MRSAPSVVYPVGRSRFGAGVVVLAALAGLLSLLAWCWLGPAPGWRHLSVGVLWLGCGCLGWHAHRQTAAGQLSWDGAAWTWTLGTSSCAVTVEAVIDLQFVLLLRLGEPGGRACAAWYWVAHDEDTMAWQALRRAVYSRASRQAQSEAPAVNP